MRDFSHITEKTTFVKLSVIISHCTWIVCAHTAAVKVWLVKPIGCKHTVCFSFLFHICLANVGFYLKALMNFTLPVFLATCTDPRYEVAKLIIADRNNEKCMKNR